MVKRIAAGRRRRREARPLGPLETWSAGLGSTAWASGWPRKVRVAVDNTTDVIDVPAFVAAVRRAYAGNDLASNDAEAVRAFLSAWGGPPLTSKDPRPSSSTKSSPAARFGLRTEIGPMSYPLRPSSARPSA